MKRIVMKHNDRTYHVLMAALAEEARIVKLSGEEIAKRSREIWDSCYGKEPVLPATIATKTTGR